MTTLFEQIKKSDRNLDVILGYRQLINWGIVWIGAYYILFGEELIPKMGGMIILLMGIAFFFNQMHANIDMLEVAERDE